MTTLYYPDATRPPDITDLISRLQTNTLDAREREALQALCQTAVKQVLNGSEFMQLLRTFVNSISTGTQDQTSIDPFHLRCLAYVVRQGEGKLSTKSTPLGPLLSTLQRRLDFACQQNDQQAQYELICTLSLVLDAMADIGISKLSRESLHQPLLKLLKNLKGDKELHLAQAAVYARQALLGISDDDTVLDASLRGALRVMDLALMAFGAVSSHDLHKLFEAAKGVFAGARDLKGYARDAFKARRGSHWYMALRMTDILFRSRAVDKMVEFIEIATRDNKSEELLCGLYAQLEQGEEYLSLRDFKRIYDAIPGSKSDRVRAWAQYLTERHDHLQPNQVGGSHSGHPLPDKSDYTWALDRFCWNASTGEHSESTSRILMGQVYRKCDSARRFYTRNALLQHYARNANERLNIQRVDGNLLPMDRCYINLAIVDHGKNGQKVTLPTLFDIRKRDSGNTIQPRRIFIEGQAGVGKTTLCKKLVHDYIYQGQWQDRFDWLLWIPLRNLRGTRSRSYNLEHFFRDEYFSLHHDRDLLAETLFEVSLNRSSRVLFVLDGLDEISRDLNADDPMESFVDHLLEQPQVIATSRPYYLRCLDRMKPDLELRTTGFDLNQIQSYVHTRGITPNDETARQIWSFIEVNPRLRGFVQIPALLDTFCYCWNDTLDSLNRGKLGTAMTMTDIYESLTMKLLKKDFRRCKQEPLNEEDLKGDHIVEGLMHDEINLLEGLAFHGMLNDVFEFDVDFREQIYRHLGAQKIAIPGLPEKALKGLSFLRTSDKDMEQDKKKFHFLHRTVQEYFAARLFTKHWIQMHDMFCVVLQQEDKDLKSSLRYDVGQISLREFLEDGKYNLRYDMIWRFVTGLLRGHWNQSTRKKKPLLRYFDVLESGPRDLLGPAHAYLMMGCLSEVIRTNEPVGFDVYRKRIERELYRWAVVEQEIGNAFDARILYHPDFPDHLFSSLLRNYPDFLGDDVVIASQKRTNISLSTADLIASWIDQHVASGSNTAFAIHCMEFLFSKADLLSEKAACAFAKRISEGDTWVRAPVLGASYFHCALPAEALKAVIKRLDDRDIDARVQSTRILIKQRSLGPKLLALVKKTLVDSSPRVKLASLEGLQQCSNLTTEIFDILVQLHGDSHRDVRYTASLRLADQPSLPPEILDSIYKLFLVRSDDTKAAAAAALSNQMQLPPNILGSLVRQLGHGEVAQVAIVAALSRTLPTEIMNSLLEKMDDKSYTVRQWTARALGQQRTLPPTVLEKLAILLDDEDESVRSEALEALARQPAWELQHLSAIVRKLRDDELSVRRKAVEVLGSQRPLPQHILDHLCRYLGEKPAPRLSVLEILKHQPVQPHHLDSLVMYFKKEDPGSGFCVDILQILGCQESLPDSILRFLEGNLDPTRTASITCQETLQALDRQSDLPTDILVRVAQCLGEPNLFRTAAGVLRRQKKDTLPSHLLCPIAEAITNYIIAGNEAATTVAVAALSEQRHLAEPIFHLICSKFSDIGWGPVFDALVVALHTTDTFYPKLLRLPTYGGPYLDSLVRHGLVHRWALYFQRGTLILDLPAHRKQISMRFGEMATVWIMYAGPLHR
ncbi:hypothetical protein BJX96DRAFT_179928 [Aspergillus floccosus]